MGRKSKSYYGASAGARMRKKNMLEKLQSARRKWHNLQKRRGNAGTSHENDNEESQLPSTSTTRVDNELEILELQSEIVEVTNECDQTTSFRLRASTSSTAQVSAEDLFVEVPPTTVLETEGPDASKQQLPPNEEQVIKEPKPLPKLRQRRPPIPATMSTRSTLRVTEADKEQLAGLVRGHPVLYDTRYMHFKNKAQTHYAWQDISRRMQRTESECISIWKILKESYKAAVRRRKLRMDQGVIVKPSKYEDFMSFVKPFLIKTGAAAAEPPSGGAAPRLKQLACGVAGKALTADPTRSGAFPAQPQRNNFVEFFRNLGGTVKDFPIDVKNRVKNEVLKVVSDAREFVLCNTSVEQLFVVEDIKEEPLET